MGLLVTFAPQCICHCQESHNNLPNSLQRFFSPARPKNFNQLMAEVDQKLTVSFSNVNLSHKPIITMCLSQQIYLFFDISPATVFKTSPVSDSIKQVPSPATSVMKPIEGFHRRKHTSEKTQGWHGKFPILPFGLPTATPTLSHHSARHPRHHQQQSELLANAAQLPECLRRSPTNCQSGSAHVMF